MIKINFQNNITKANADTFNTMQDNIEDSIDTKQDTLVSGTNIKTINGSSILGSGNVEISGEVDVDDTVSTSSTNPIENQAITNYVNTMNEYSTTEIDTGKKWTNGKPIYRKVVETTTGSSTGNWTKIVDLPLDTLVSMHGWWITGNDKYPIDRFYNNEGITIYWNLGGIYEIHNYAYASSKSAVLIIEYTKTTD